MTQDDDNYRHFTGTIEGPPDSPYEGGVFKLEFFYPDNYPTEPPKFRFLTKIYHPNIDQLGRICLDILKGEFTTMHGLIFLFLLANWAPALQMHAVLLSLQALLGCPNPDDPLANDVANEWKTNEEGAVATGIPILLPFYVRCNA